jgi:3-phenylpropionate/trans-cinnamate dioxygenase ferredoxin subunit
MYQRLCDVMDVSPGEMKQFDLNEREFLVANIAGQFYCLEGRCTHARAPLFEGELAGNVLAGPWHYTQFNIIDGPVLRGPTKRPLRIYRTMMKEGQIFVDI